MLDERVLSVLRDDMSIDIEHLMSKLRSSSMSRYTNESLDILEFFVTSLGCKNPKDKINHVAKKYEDTISDGEFETFIDSMRHAFVAFSQGGLHDLFLYQENQAWYPKVRLKQVLNPNDIHSLNEVITLYRGCDIYENNNGKYGQSWSTSEDVSREFAFVHYSSEVWFNRTSRCVLKATLHRDNVYYSDQKKHEREVVVDTTKLMGVQVCA